MSQGNCLGGNCLFPGNKDFLTENLHENAKSYTQNLSEAFLGAFGFVHYKKVKVNVSGLTWTQLCDCETALREHFCNSF